ncbi:MAG: hypothetical protein ABIN55_08940 [Aeromicrobium sp.]
MSQKRLPAEIYWRRRLLFVAVVIALIWVGTQVFGGGDDPKADPKATATATTTAAPVATPTDGVLSVNLASATGACDPEKIRITPTVKSGQLTKAPVTVGLVVSSTETKPCTLTPSVADLLVVISANKVAVWDSTVCKTSLLTNPVAISAGWATLVQTTWSGRGSGSKCSTKEGFATPGTYTIQAGTLGGEPGKTTFDLNPAPKPKATATPSPTKKTPSAKNTTKPADE